MTHNGQLPLENFGGFVWKSKSHSSPATRVIGYVAALYSGVARASPVRWGLSERQGHCGQAGHHFPQGSTGALQNDSDQKSNALVKTHFISA